MIELEISGQCVQCACEMQSFLEWRSQRSAAGTRIVADHALEGLPGVLVGGHDLALNARVGMRFEATQF